MARLRVTVSIERCGDVERGDPMLSAKVSRTVDEELPAADTVQEVAREAVTEYLRTRLEYEDLHGALPSD